MKHENPFSSPEESVASKAYRYRRWKIGEYRMVARCEIDAVKPKKSEKGATGYYMN